MPISGTGPWYARLVVNFATYYVVSNELGPFYAGSCNSLPNGWACDPAIFVAYISGATRYRIYYGTVAGAEDHYFEVGTVPPEGTTFRLNGAGIAGGIQDTKFPATVTLEWSDDGLATYKNPRVLDCTQAGHAKSKRVVARMLGRSRSRIYRLRTTAPLRIIDGYLQAGPGMEQPEERFPKRMARMA